MEKYRLPLTEQEEILFAQIDLTTFHGNHDEGHRAYLKNREPIIALLKSLSERDGVPDHKIKYWNDPEYNYGRIKGSRKAMFERNQCYDEDIYTHPHFIKHLRYILLGTDLPRTVVEAFEQKVDNPEWVSLSDAIELGKFARKLVRDRGLDARHASDEFFKLCLDMGLRLSVAFSIMKSVRQVR